MRETAEKEPIETLKKRVKRHSDKQGKWIPVGVIFFIAAGLIAYGAIGLWNRYHATHKENPVITSTVITHSTDTPDETPPTKACENYKVAAASPRKIEIPSIKSSGCIEKVGIDQNNAIAVPDTIYAAGWYVNSVAPGEKGVSLIDGHVLGRYNDAIFVNLKNLKKGDEIKIERGDSSTLTFSVVDVTSYPVSEVMDHLFKKLNGVESQLTLITCTGTFNRADQTYDQRIIVRAQRID